VIVLQKLAALTGRPWFWAAAIALLFGVPLARGLTQGRPPPPPPVLGSFPEFILRADDGSEFRAADLHGRAFIAGVICGGCADRAGREAILRTLQHRTRNLGDALRLVSFAQDLDPRALRELRARDAAGQRWVLLAGIPEGAAGLFASGGLLVVDGGLRIRGRYDSRRGGEIDRLLRDTGLVTALR